MPSAKRPPLCPNGGLETERNSVCGSNLSKPPLAVKYKKRPSFFGVRCARARRRKSARLENLLEALDRAWVVARLRRMAGE